MRMRSTELHESCRTGWTNSIPVSSLVRVRVHGASRPVAPWGTGRPSRPDSGGTGPVTSRIMSVDLESNVLSAVSGRKLLINPHTRNSHVAENEGRSVVGRGGTVVFVWKVE